MGLETVAIGGLVASTALGVVSSVEQGAAQQRAADYQAQVAANNAAINAANAQTAKNNAAAAEAAGAAKADQEAIRTRETIGRQRAAAAASGLDVNSGTPALVQGSAAGMGALSELNIRDETNRKGAAYAAQAQGYTMAAEQNLGDSAAAVRSGEDAMTGGLLKGVGTLASGAAQTSKLYSDYQRTGVKLFDVPSIT
jgi:SOS-response transcriptional repressor LexA